MNISQLILMRAEIPQHTIESTYLVVEHDIIISNSIENLDLTGVIFNEIKIDTCSVIEIDFSGNQFYSCIFDNCVFDNCSFINCDIRDLFVNGSKFVNCKFGRAELYDCSFENCEFFDNDMKWVFYNNCTFDGGGIQNCSLDNSIIAQTKFVNVKFLDNNSKSLTLPDSEIIFKHVKIFNQEDMVKKITGEFKM